MKKSILSVVLLLVSLVVFAQRMSDEAILSEIRENPYRSAGCHSIYFGGEFKDTPAPTGYKPFYVSHLGRHGSRYESISFSKDALDMMSKLRNADLLTAAGDSLLLEIQHIAAAHKGMEGMLTGKGTKEQTKIALNLVRRCPGVFKQKDRPKAVFTSTAVARTIQSMAGFSAGIISAVPGLEVELNSGFNGMNFKRDADKQMSKSELSDIVKKTARKLTPGSEVFHQISHRILKDPASAEKVLDGTKLGNLFIKIFTATSGSGCLDINVNPLRFFTAEELLACYKMYDVKYNIQYGPMATTREDRGKGGKIWARKMVDEADAAIEGNNHCADFRFAHDGNIGPMMTLLGIGPFQYSSSPEEPYRNWQSYRYICMGSNLQLIFYKNKNNDILVKALYNEREIDFPGLSPINEVYYKWSEVRRYIVSKTDEIRELPEYYNQYLKDKAAEILQLQKDEADGFYFITDTHYPVNSNNSPALMEYLEKNTGVRPVVLGGDILTYLDDMDDAVAIQISAIEQVKGIAPVYWVRGNHDIVNYTGRKAWITKERNAMPVWDNTEFLARYSGKNAVRNSDDPNSMYYYYDNKAAGIRYIVIESTRIESTPTEKDKVIYDISAKQLKWIVGEAILKAPKGYHIMFFSHVNPIGTKQKSIAMVAEIIDAFSYHKTFQIEEETFDFSTRTDLSPLGIICGHRHSDFDKPFGNGIYQINVEADCNYNKARKDAEGTVNEQSFDYFSISKDFKTIRTVKIGNGKNREFKLSQK